MEVTLGFWGMSNCVGWGWRMELAHSQLASEGIPKVFWRWGTLPTL